MKPAPFEYRAPRTTGEALEALSEAGFEGKPLAGGQSLVPAMNFRLARPSVLVDLNGVEELAFIRESDEGGLRIGAMTRQRTAELDPRVAERAPLLAEALPRVAHPQIRNRGTVGGSLAHADPSAELPAVLLALGGRCRISGPDGERWVPAEEFFVGLFSTDLGPDELLTEVEVPPPPPRSGSAFREMARRHGDFALAGAAALVELGDDGRVRDARVVHLGLGDRPALAGSVREALVGEEPGPEAIRAAAEATAREDVDPPGDVHASPAYRRRLCGRLTREALEVACRRAGEAARAEGA